jgi:hydroxymethylpyrimidine pyrophosphatase-like HAD family hydrolase
MVPITQHACLCVLVRAVACYESQGTLLTSSGEVSARNAAALQRVRGEGILPIICTGKIPGPWQNIVSALELNAPMVFLQV